MKTIERQKHTIDAEGRVLGRLATEIATLLRGKQKVDFEPHIDGGDFVEVTNADKFVLTGKKLEQKVYYRHSEYPGGLKETPAQKLMEEKPEEMIKKAVWNMLPKNKLRAQAIKRLTFTK
ncbi:MAG: 50S ribosomal protein L13 [Patescibacteria group bacterium]